MDAQVKLVRAKYGFKATNNDELNFQKGDTITLTQQLEGGWYEGTLDGKTGWFPSNYVVELMPGIDERSPSSPIPITAEIPIKEQHQCMVTTGFVDSEKEYVNDLFGFLETYLKPLAAANILSAAEHTTLCGNLEQISQFQKTFLQSLSDCAKEPLLQQKIGGLFLANAIQFESLYQDYAANHPHTISILLKHRDELNVFMENNGANSPGSKTLTSHLSMPFRRLDKYPSLLKELERHIDDSHPDRGDTQRAISVYRNIQVSTVQIRKDKDMEIEILSSNIENWEGEEMSALGEVQLSAHVKIYSSTGGANDRIILLFPSCILMISVSTRMSYSYQGKLMLVGLVVKKVEDTDEYTNALEFSGSMIDEMVISFASSAKQLSWYEHLARAHSPKTIPVTAAPKSVKSLPAQVSKASVRSLMNPKTAKVVDSYDKLTNFKPWTMSCLRPLPPTRPSFLSHDDTRSPKIQRKASTLGRRKNNTPRVVSESSFLYKKIEDTKVLQEDAKILKVIEAYCTSARTRHTVNSSNTLPRSMTTATVVVAESCQESVYETVQSTILDYPNMLIPDDEKIMCEVTKDNETVIEEKSLVDTVYVIKDQISDLLKEQQKLKRDLEDERKSRRKLESLVQKTLPLLRNPMTNHSLISDSATT